MLRVAPNGRFLDTETGRVILRTGRLAFGEEGKMKREEMEQKVANELKHIPHIKGNLEQNLFCSAIIHTSAS